jgi:hypothetical protein
MLTKKLPVLQNDFIAVTQLKIPANIASKNTLPLKNVVYPQGNSNPRYLREREVS